MHEKNVDLKALGQDVGFPPPMFVMQSNRERNLLFQRGALFRVMRLRAAISRFSDSVRQPVRAQSRQSPALPGRSRRRGRALTSIAVKRRASRGCDLQSV